MSWLSGLYGGGKDESGQTTSNADSNQVWGRWTVAPQYSFTEPRLQLTSDFISDQIKRINAGKYPSYYENALPSLREGMHQPLYKTYYGGAGEPGVLRGQMDVGSITGLGPRKTQAGVERSLSEYATGEKQIDEYLTKLGVDIMQKDAYTFPSLSMAMPKGPDAQYVNPQTVGGQQTGYGDFFSSLGSMFNLGGMLGGKGDVVKTQNQTPNQTPYQTIPWSNQVLDTIAQTDYSKYASIGSGQQNYQNYYQTTPTSPQISMSYTSKDYGLYS